MISQAGRKTVDSVLPPRLGQSPLAVRLATSRQHVLASATLAAGYAGQLAFQMGYFLILTRMLGPEVFGQFATALAALNLVAPIAGFGFAEVALFRVSQDHGKSGLWAGSGLAATAALGGMVSVALAITASELLSPRLLDWPVMLGLAVSELVIVRCCLFLARVSQARQEITATSLIYVAIAALKMVLALILLMLGTKSIGVLVISLNLCFLPLLIILVFSLRSKGARLSVSLVLLRQNLWMAISFATGLVCRAAYTDLDKLILARWTTTHVVGTYAAGYKILAFSAMPMRAILEATFPRQVQLAERDGRACRGFMTKLLFLNITLGGCISGVLYVFAPLASRALGKDYVDSVTVLQLGFLLPVLQAFHGTLGNYLTATGHQAARTRIQLFTVGIYIVVGLLCIPIYSWRGAILTCLGCEGLMGTLMGIACVLVANRGKLDTYIRSKPNEPCKT